MPAKKPYSANLLDYPVLIDQPGIIEFVLQQYQLPITGLHGIAHWARVYEIGQHLTICHNRTADAEDQVDARIPALFAMLHDACRLSEGSDHKHGPRAAVLARKMRDQGKFDIWGEDFGKLELAIYSHTDGATSEDPTIQICFDSDRLDLPRVGIVPAAQYLSQLAWDADGLRNFAYLRAVAKDIPALVFTQWGMEYRKVAAR